MTLKNTENTENKEVKSDCSIVRWRVSENIENLHKDHLLAPHSSPSESL